MPRGWNKYWQAIIIIKRYNRYIYAHNKYKVKGMSKKQMSTGKYNNRMT